MKRKRIYVETHPEYQGIYANDAKVWKVRSADHIVQIPVRKLADDFTCPICLGIIRHVLLFSSLLAHHFWSDHSLQAMVVKSCLHRFCRECIEKSLHYGKKKCPKCRSACQSKRHLRDDVTFNTVNISLVIEIYSEILTIYFSFSSPFSPMSTKLKEKYRD